MTVRVTTGALFKDFPGNDWSISDGVLSVFGDPNPDILTRSTKVAVFRVWDYVEYIESDTLPQKYYVKVDREGTKTNPLDDAGNLDFKDLFDKFDKLSKLGRKFLE